MVMEGGRGGGTHVLIDTGEDEQHITASPFPMSSSGMRVLGVTTTLSVSAMEGAAPDRILAGISKIQLEDLTSLDYVQAAGYHEVEANCSSGGASTATAAAPASGLASSAGTAAAPPKDKVRCASWHLADSLLMVLSPSRGVLPEWQGVRAC